MLSHIDEPLGDKILLFESQIPSRIYCVPFTSFISGHYNGGLSILAARGHIKLI
jgi:hypothetical protein